MVESAFKNFSGNPQVLPGMLEKRVDFIAPRTQPGIDMMVGDSTQVSAPAQQMENKPAVAPQGMSGAIVSLSNRLTQAFGNRNARYDKISGGVNRGADFAIPAGTPVAAPKNSDWEVVEAFGDARAQGPGNAQSMINRGYGNSVLMRNTRTGELMRFSHLSSVGVKPGQIIKGGQVVGSSGATGHVAGRTGQHLDVEYIDGRGRLANVMNSPYAGMF